MTLQDFFQQHPDTALAFSGGVDSAYLLYAALNWGRRVRAYFVRSAFQPDFELRDAQRLADELGASLTVLDADVLSVPRIAENPPDRCYYCKQTLFRTVLDAAAKDGFPVLMDGTNASDNAGERPGMRALQELRVRSPLRECGLSKDDIRQLSRAAGLFTWEKPAYACLATRIPTGDRITAEKLRNVEAAEDFMFSLGFSDFRVRLLNGCARIQIPEGQIPRLLEHREAVLREFSQLFRAVLMDLEVRGEQ